MDPEIRAPRVVDERVPAKGLLPSRMLAYLVIGGAVLLASVSLVTNLHATRKAVAGTGEPRPQADDPKRLVSFRTQLDADSERARALALEPPPKAIPDQRKVATWIDADEYQAPRQQGYETRQNKDHDSLFAATMVLSQRPAESTHPSTDRLAEPVLLSAQVPVVAGPGPVAQPVPEPVGQKPDKTIRTPPISAAGPMHILLEGTVLDATLLHRLEGSNSSPVKATIAGPVYSHNRQFVLIPDGTIALGMARAVQNYNETRLAVTFHRLEFPDGSTVSLDLDPGLDQAGDLGVHDKVNNHYLATFGRAAAVGVIVGLGQAVGYRSISGGGNDRAVIIAGEVGNSTTTAVSSLLNKMPLPTIEITEGHRLKIYLTHDLELPAWSRTGTVRPVR